MAWGVPGIKTWSKTNLEGRNVKGKVQVSEKLWRWGDAGGRGDSSRDGTGRGAGQEGPDRDPWGTIRQRRGNRAERGNSKAAAEASRGRKKELLRPGSWGREAGKQQQHGSAPCPPGTQRAPGYRQEPQSQTCATASSPQSHSERGKPGSCAPVRLGYETGAGWLPLRHGGHRAPSTASRGVPPPSGLPGGGTATPSTTPPARPSQPAAIPPPFPASSPAPLARAGRYLVPGAAISSPLRRRSVRWEGQGGVRGARRHLAGEAARLRGGWGDAEAMAAPSRSPSACSREPAWGASQGNGWACGMGRGSP